LLTFLVIYCFQFFIMDFDFWVWSWRAWCDLISLVKFLSLTFLFFFKTSKQILLIYQNINRGVEIESYPKQRHTIYWINKNMRYMQKINCFFFFWLMAFILKLQKKYKRVSSPKAIVKRPKGYRKQPHKNNLIVKNKPNS